MKHLRRKLVHLTVAAVLGLSANAARAQGTQYDVAVTNLTRGQVFTPILVATHEPGLKIFTLGAPASPMLEALAEAGDVGPLAASLASMSAVLDVADSGAPLGPGETAHVLVNTRGKWDHLVVAAMLIPTNDGFFAVNGMPGPKGANGVVVYFSPAYDAGTEANDEDCAGAIPGPPGVCGGEGVSSPASSDEGYVHIHAGIHGIGGALDPATYDWRNPVARIEVRRVK